MDLTNWIEYQKIEDGYPCRTNTVYVPLMNSDHSILCMDFGNKEIKFDNTFFFNRELEYLEKFKNYSWAPTVLNVNVEHKQIFIKWFEVTCNNLLREHSLDILCKNWKMQLRAIIKDILNSNTYKLTLYPHCFYIDNTLSLKTFDFYACVDKDNSVLPVELVKNIIGKQSIERWDEAIDQHTVNFELFFNRALEKYIKWNGQTLEEIINGL
jgi:hypothetical protein